MLLALFGLLLLAGCSTAADTGSGTRNNRNNGFYGGAAGGVAP